MSELIIILSAALRNLQETWSMSSLGWNQPSPPNRNPFVKTSAISFSQEGYPQLSLPSPLDWNVLVNMYLNRLHKIILFTVAAWSSNSLMYYYVALRPSPGSFQPYTWLTSQSHAWSCKCAKGRSEWRGP